MLKNILQITICILGFYKKCLWQQSIAAQLSLPFPCGKWLAWKKMWKHWIFLALCHRFSFTSVWKNNVLLNKTYWDYYKQFVMRNRSPPVLANRRDDLDIKDQGHSMIMMASWSCHIIWIGRHFFSLDNCLLFMDALHTQIIYFQFYLSSF